MSSPTSRDSLGELAVEPLVLPRSAGESTLLFVSGVHGSGSAFLHELLLRHPRIGGLTDATGARISGERVQSVIPADEYLGGAAGSALHPRAHLTESHALADPVAAARLRREWGARFEQGKPVVVEHSPGHLLRSRYLASVFPGSAHLFVRRHPVTTAYAVRRELGEPSLPLDHLVVQWLRAYDLLESDLPHLDRFTIVELHALLQGPQQVMDGICRDLGLAGYPVDRRTGAALPDAVHWREWERESPEVRSAILRLEPEMRRHGYSLDRPASVARSPTAAPRVPAVPSPAPGREGARGASPTVPKRLLFVSFGSRGDIQPCVTLALRFRSEGYHVVLCSSEDHRAFVESFGLHFESVGPGSGFEFPIRADLPPTAQEGRFFDALREFYERYGEGVIGTLGRVVAAERIECVMVGSCVFFRPFLNHALRIPCVELSLSALCVGAPEADDHGGYGAIEVYARNLVRHSAAAANYKISEALDRAYAACGYSFRHEQVGVIRSLIDVKSTLALQGFAPRVGENRVPGLPWVATGFWPLEDDALAAGPIDEALERFLDASAPPICLNFGSMDIFRADACPWSESLLQAIRDTGEPCVAIGSAVPESVRDWTFWVPSADHSRVFPRCRVVIHHGGAGTAAQCMRSGVPALIVPVLRWADQPLWADWVEAEGAGIHVRRPEDGFAEPLARLRDPAFRENARRVAAALAAEDGPGEAVRAFERHFAADAPGLHDAREAFGHIESLPVAEQRKIAMGALVLVHEPTGTVGESGIRRDRLLRALGDATRRTPIYKADWPRTDAPLDLLVQDLPHPSSLQEWWYFHAHLRSKQDGREISIFAALFQRLFGDRRLNHLNASLLDASTGRHFTRSVGEPDAPRVISGMLRSEGGTQPLVEALREVYEKGSFPAPDVAATRPFRVPNDRMDYDLEEMRLSKEADGSYRVTLASAGEFGFDLRFRPLKPPTLNGERGIVPGPSNDDAMFYYSITRLEVTGSVQIGDERHEIEGSGWYDHEFGGDVNRSSAPAKLGAFEWLWMGVQLDDGSEIVYATLLDRTSDEELQADVVMRVAPDGSSSWHRGRVEALRTWVSMRTYAEYDAAWRLSVPDLDLEIEVEVAAEAQEFITVIANPAYWEGRARAKGTWRGSPVAGLAFVEQVGRAPDPGDYKAYLEAVSRQVLRSVEAVAPREPTYEQFRDLVADEEFEALLDGLSIDVFARGVLHPIRDIVDRGGKGWRSLVFMTCVDAVGGDSHSLRDFLCYPELLHTASLIIDDIEDNSSVRRGGPSAHVTYGVPVALNAGSAGYFLCERLFARLPLTPEAHNRIYSLYFSCMRGAHAGQAMDIHGLHHMVPAALLSGDFQPLWRSLMAIHRLKSGLPATTAARIGAVLGGGSPREEKLLGDYLLALGIAFQVMDDAINLIGFRGDLKTRAEDLAEGKLTAPVVRAFQLLEEPERGMLWKELSAPAGQRNVAAMLRLIERCGAIDWCHAHARAIVGDAWALLDAGMPDSYAKVVLRAFGNFVVEERDY